MFFRSVIEWIDGFVKERYLLNGYILIGVFTILYTLLVLHRYWQFQYFFTDNVYFHKALWDVAHLRLPMVEHKYLGNIIILGDHFSPTIFLLVIPLWLGLGQVGTQLAMIMPFSLGMILALHVGKVLVRSRIFVLVIVVTSYLYLGLQHAMIFGFHEIHLVPFFFWLMIWAFYTHRRRVYIISITLLLLTKESMPLVLASWGIFLLMSYRKRYVQHSVVLIMISIAYFIIVTGVIIPSLGGRFLYSPVLEHGSNIAGIVESMFTPVEKVRTLALSLGTFGLLPIMSISVIPMVLQDFFIRYVSSIPGNMQYSITFHYGVGVVPILTFASIWSLHTLERSGRSFLRVLLVTVALVVTVWGHFAYLGRGPLQQVLIPDFYKVTRDNAFLWELINATPHDGSVMTMNHLGFALADRDVYQLSPDTVRMERISPKYIVYDLRREQSPANYLPFDSYEKYRSFMDTVERSPQYEEIFRKGSLRILRRR